MKNKLPTIARILLGLVFFVFGLNGFFNFIPQQALPEKAVGFVTGLMSAGYFFPFMKSIEVISGALLLANAFVPLALLLLAPIIVNIFLFHTILAPAGFIMGLVLVLLEAYLAWTKKDIFAHVLKK